MKNIFRSDNALEFPIRLTNQNLKVSRAQRGNEQIVRPAVAIEVRTVKPQDLFLDFVQDERLYFIWQVLDCRSWPVELCARGHCYFPGAGEIFRAS
jgi:hypothetical protein